jgi:hypothetical protein
MNVQAFGLHVAHTPLLFAQGRTTARQSDSHSLGCLGIGGGGNRIGCRHKAGGIEMANGRVVQMASSPRPITVHPSSFWCLCARNDSPQNDSSSPPHPRGGIFRTFRRPASPLTPPNNEPASSGQRPPQWHAQIPYDPAVTVPAPLHTTSNKVCVHANSVIPRTSGPAAREPVRAADS